VWWTIACLFALLFASPALSADTVAKKSAADVAVGKKCLSCHGPEEDPGIYGEWKKSSHAAKNVDCYDCHKLKEGEKGAFEHHGAFIQVIVTPMTCAKCHQAEVTQQQRSHHAKAGNILASVDNLLGEVIGGPAAVNAGCKQCHGSTVELDAKGRPIPQTELPLEFRLPPDLGRIGELEVRNGEDTEAGIHG
jgi:hypothetical protein